MKRQSKEGVVAHAASDARELAITGAEIVAAGVVLTAGIFLAAAELAVAKLLLSEKKRAHASARTS